MWPADLTSAETQTIVEEFLATFAESCSTQTLESFLGSGDDVLNRSYGQVSTRDVGTEGEGYHMHSRGVNMADVCSVGTATVAPIELMLPYLEPTKSAGVHLPAAGQLLADINYDNFMMGFDETESRLFNDIGVCNIETQTVLLDGATPSSPGDDFLTEYLATGSQTIADWQGGGDDYAAGYARSTETQTAFDDDFNLFLTNMETQTNDEFVFELGLGSCPPLTDTHGMVSCPPVADNLGLVSCPPLADIDTQTSWFSHNCESTSAQCDFTGLPSSMATQTRY